MVFIILKLPIYSLRTGLLNKKIEKENIIYMNFESADWYEIKNYKDLYNYVKDKYRVSKLYLLLDEVQNVESWEKAVNSFLVDIDVDVYVTGSNAYLLSSELTTFLAGRVYTVKIYSFKNNEDKYQMFDKYCLFLIKVLLGIEISETM